MLPKIKKVFYSPKGVIEDYNEYQRTGEVRRPLPNETSSSSDTDLESDEDDDEIFRAYRANQIDRIRSAEKVLALQKDVVARKEYKTNTHSAQVIELNEENYVETVESKGYGMYDTRCWTVCLFTKFSCDGAV